MFDPALLTVDDGAEHLCGFLFTKCGVAVAIAVANELSVQEGFAEVAAGSDLSNSANSEHEVTLLQLCCDRATGT
ncbi:hypothetical protein LBMAG46_18050 [Planctomycetia bacterium]|nr:hypothetical protein LBMAG46_18050 [Planctomycetia bacterium]